MNEPTGIFYTITGELGTGSKNGVIMSLTYCLYSNGFANWSSPPVRSDAIHAMFDGPKCGIYYVK